MCWAHMQSSLIDALVKVRMQLGFSCVCQLIRSDSWLGDVTLLIAFTDSHAQQKQDLPFEKKAMAEGMFL